MAYVQIAVGVAKAAFALGTKIMSNPVGRELVFTSAGMALDKLAQPSSNPETDNKLFSRQNLAMAANGAVSWMANNQNVTAEQLNNIAIIANSIKNDGVRSLLSNEKSQSAINDLSQGVLQVLKPEQENALRLPPEMPQAKHSFHRVM